jgi:hypothetical protein
MSRVIRFVFKCALYGVAGILALYALFVMGALAVILFGEELIPRFKLGDHMSKDQQCAVYPPSKGCPGNR